MVRYEEAHFTTRGWSVSSYNHSKGIDSILETNREPMQGFVLSLEGH